MPKRMMLALFIATLAVGPATGPASAQQGQRGGLRTETMRRLAGDNSGYDIFWNAIGLLGLIGLRGLFPKHEEDSYHPAPLE